MPDICVRNRVSIGLGNGLSPIQYQAIISTNAWLLSIGPLGTKFSEIAIKIQNFSFKKMFLKILSAKWQPFCPGGDELNKHYTDQLLRLFLHYFTLIYDIHDHNEWHKCICYQPYLTLSQKSP